jgi:peptidoglycan/xylan/chitin deacetylase (PgdA/CDA1 family)
MKKSFLVANFGVLLALVAWMAVHPVLSEAPAPEKAAAGAPVTTAPEETSFTVLCYHRFAAHPERFKEPLTEYRLPLVELEWQMQYLKDHGITPISMGQLKDYWFYGKPLPAKPVLLTFDDGDRSIYEVAFPVLRKYGFPGVLFIYTDFIHNQGDSLHLPDIRAMQKAGWALESHTKSHFQLGLEDEKRPTVEFLELLRTELLVPIRFMKEKFDYDTTTLAYPYGIYNEKIVTATRENGYQLAFGVNPKPAYPAANDHTVPPLKLKRNLVTNPIDHEVFAGFFDMKVLHLEAFQPGDGEVIRSHNPWIVVTIKEDIDPSTLQLVLGERPMKFKYDPRTHRLTHRISGRLKPGGHTLILSAVDKVGQKRSYTWYFRVKHESFEPPETNTEHKL